MDNEAQAINTNPNQFKLSQPVKAHGELTDTVTLRRPTVRECRQIGQLPYRIEKDESVGLNLDVAAKYIVVCAGIPGPAVDAMDVNDLNTLAWAIAGFFMASPAKPKAKAEAPEAPEAETEASAS